MMEQQAAWKNGHHWALALFVGIMLVWLASMAFLMHRSRLPDVATGPMLVVFPPQTPADEVLAKLTAAESTPISTTAYPFIWLVTSTEPGLAGRLRQHGALGSYRELPINNTIAGCFAYADAQVKSFTAP